MAHFLKAFARTWATRELRGLSAVWLVAFAPALTAWRDLPAQTAPAQEYQLKAVFLKTNTRRQAELAALISRLRPALRS